MSVGGAHWAAGPARRPRGPRGPALIQVVLSVVLAVVLAAVTLTTRQPPPPAIAELAPQAAEQIKEVPQEQSSEFGSGAGPGDCPPGASCAAGVGGGPGAGSPGADPADGAASTTAAARVVGPASVKRCVGDPPRQIEDPQSPPCIAYWDDSNGNGGSTSPGVDKDTITIAVVNDSGIDDGLATFFNNRFQLYGRKIKLVRTGANGAAGADAAAAMGAFAALPSYNDVPFYRQLAKKKIVGAFRTPDFSDSELAAAAPYLWGYPMSFTQMMANLADWACRRLVGQLAAHAGKNDLESLAESTRSFAVFLDRATPDASVSPGVLATALEQCGARVPFTTSYPRFDQDPIRIRNEIAKVKAEGVTTIFCLCVSTNLGSLQSQATASGYEPEWIISNYPQLVQGDGYAGTQLNRTFGLSFAPMDRVPEDHPVYWALKESDPENSNADQRMSIGTGSNDIVYRGWLLLAAGLQMAGPLLSPETFKQGLQKTRFPNPDHPIMAGHVGFHGDFSMTDDGAEFWFSETSPGPYGDTASGPTLCWVDGGRRHAKGTWPKGGDPFYNGPCDSGSRSVS